MVFNLYLIYTILPHTKQEQTNERMFERHQGRLVVHLLVVLKEKWIG